MRRAVASVQAMPEFETFLTAHGATALKAGPQEVAALTRDELARWEPVVVRESGMKID